MTILVTGGAGYIGSRTVFFLLKKGYDVVVVDNLSRGNKPAIPDGAHFVEMAIEDPAMDKVFATYRPDAVIHFAAYAYVGESNTQPLLYYCNNTAATIRFLDSMTRAGVRNIVFSSTCSLYGNPVTVPITEAEPVKPMNTYAVTKAQIEKALEDCSAAGLLNYAALRYFNAAGAAPDGSMGESHDPEPHLIPLVLMAAQNGTSVKIFGDDYPTPDGTCIRDYIHIDDLASAHILAVEKVINEKKNFVLNLGTGAGNSVKEIITRSEAISGRAVKAELAPRRPGDPAVLVADNKNAVNELGWKPQYNIEDILTHAWNWLQNKRY
ncbi:MAG: UDP-glucose 4-epimerase GalE [Ignavibacteriales bacterium]|nr:MAG: UDP-glucose 4-epimerase GalE [Ignavibacteriales bacterium]